MALVGGAHLSAGRREGEDTASGKERWATGRKRGWAEMTPSALFLFFVLFYFFSLFLISISFVSFAK
jgi:hypothetical protein